MLRSLFYTALVILCIGCATVSSPQGGPVDSLPPRVVGTSPAPYSVRFAGKKITIDFNEYVQLREQSKLFFVSPAPKRKPSLSIKGRSVVVEFRDSLDPQTTYRLDFGSSIVDNNEGNKLDGFSFVFSTGEVIDSLYMAGQVVDAQTQDTVIGAFIHFFDAEADSLTLDSVLFKSRANAVFRTDSSGFFVADILKEKPYRIYAFFDKNGDQAYQPGADQIGFLDSIYNPIDLPPFSIAYDSATRRSMIDPIPFRFELFTEVAVIRQNLQGHARVGRNQLNLTFSAQHARFDSLILNGVDPSWLIEDRNATGDSISFWVAPPTQELFKALPDSIYGSFVYMRQDSVMNYHPKHEKLNFYNKTFVAKENKRIETKKKREEEKEKEALAADSTASKEPKKEKTPFGFHVSAQQTLNPEHGIGFTFSYPLRSLDSSRIVLTRIEVDPKVANRSGRRRASTEAEAEVPKIRTPERFSFDSLSRRHWVLRAPWKTGTEYELMIPDSVFTDITFSTNDTLSSKFTIADPEKFGMIKFQTLAETSDTLTYLVELLTGQSKEFKVAQVRRGVRAGDLLSFLYLPPGFYTIRVTEDLNANGKWDTGSLTTRKHPERARYFRSANGGRSIEAKENWEIHEQATLGRLFSLPEPTEPTEPPVSTTPPTEEPDA